MHKKSFVLWTKWSHVVNKIFRERHRTQFSIKFHERGLIPEPQLTSSFNVHTEIQNRKLDESCSEDVNYRNVIKNSASVESFLILSILVASIKEQPLSHKYM